MTDATLVRDYTRPASTVPEHARRELRRALFDPPPGLLVERSLDLSARPSRAAMASPAMPLPSEWLGALGECADQAAPAAASCHPPRGQTSASRSWRMPSQPALRWVRERGLRAIADGLRILCALLERGFSSSPSSCSIHSSALRTTWRCASWRTFSLRARWWPSTLSGCPGSLDHAALLAPRPSHRCTLLARRASWRRKKLRRAPPARVTGRVRRGAFGVETSQAAGVHYHRVGRLALLNGGPNGTSTRVTTRRAHVRARSHRRGLHRNETTSWAWGARPVQAL